MDMVLYHPDDGLGGWARALADALLAPPPTNGRGRSAADDLNRGLLTVNEWRARNGLPPVSWVWSPLQRAQTAHDMDMPGEVDDQPGVDTDDDAEPEMDDDPGFDGEVVDTIGAGSLDLLLLDDGTVLLSVDGDTGELPALDPDELATLADALRELADADEPVEDREVLDWLTADVDEDGVIRLSADTDDGTGAFLTVEPGDVDALLDAVGEILDRPDSEE